MSFKETLESDLDNIFFKIPEEDAEEDSSEFAQPVFVIPLGALANKYRIPAIVTKSAEEVQANPHQRTGMYASAVSDFMVIQVPSHSLQSDVSMQDQIEVETVVYGVENFSDDGLGVTMVMLRNL
jgi:hypothetical protein